MAVLAYRDLIRRIRAAQKTQQITKTMQMVAASRLRKSQERFLQSKPYREAIIEIFSNLQVADATLTHPLLVARPVKTTVLVVVTSDRGLCGTYNANIIHYAETFLAHRENVALVLIGKKGDDYFKKRPWPILQSYLNLAGKTDVEQISKITEMLKNAYLNGQCDEVSLVYTAYKSILSLRPVSAQLFPIAAFKSYDLKQMGGNGRSREGVNDMNSDKGASSVLPVRGEKVYLEPSCEAILNDLLPMYVASTVYVSLMEAFTAENSARMIAMKNATDNANEMIRHLTLLRNKARQGTITKELLETVTAGEALRQ